MMWYYPTPFSPPTNDSVTLKARVAALCKQWSACDTGPVVILTLLSGGYSTNLEFSE